jgi:OFA family oxalate/formate antiporter-like MFS transporter
MLGLQGACLLLMPHFGNPVLFFILAAIIYLAYGGGFGTMPATAGDYFGVKNAGAIYGLMLIGWSLGGIIGPILASWLLGDDLDFTTAYTVIGIVSLVSVALTFITKVPKARSSAAHGATGAATADADAERQEAARRVLDLEQRVRTLESQVTPRRPVTTRAT